MRCEAPGIVALLLAAALGAQSEVKFAANRSSEPLAAAFSLDKAVAFMDDAARTWNTTRGCVTCHTNGLYLIARASKADFTRAAAYRETRKLASSYLKDYVSGGKSQKGQRGAVEGLVATASFLAISDMATQRRLSATTREGLDYIWGLQSEEGAWSEWLKCRWPPYEVDDHFGATLAAVALGKTPSSYRRRKTTRAAEQKLRSYLGAHPPANLHHKGMMLWVAANLEDVVAPKQRDRWVRELREHQRDDGGWRLSDLGDDQWRRPKDEAAQLPSDAYATGFAVFALRQGGVAADDEALQRGLHWLRGQQRASGRWFVRSPRRDGKHYISHAATQFAVMAFASCGVE
jgi:squalene-hopene/tetraprenyl-beta-curcumene cyclase